jgi:hypothetical protein
VALPVVLAWLGLYVVMLIAMPVWFVLILWSNAHPEFGENVEFVEWLPANARNVSYYKTYSWTAYEFDIDERSFRGWASRYELKEIADPQEIERYNYYSDFLEQRGDTRDSEWYKAYEAERKKYVAIVTHGLYDFERRGNGAGYHVVFHRLKQRAYFRCNPR